jgi:hypothetical protein
VSSFSTSKTAEDGLHGFAACLGGLSSEATGTALNTAADMAESVMDLQMAENGYQAVLGAVARLSMPSLLDFLR